MSEVKETKIVVYSKNNCPNCDQVKWALKNTGFEFVEKNIEHPVDGAENKAAFDKYGYIAAPVTVFPNGTVLAGFDHGAFATALGF